MSAVADSFDVSRFVGRHTGSQPGPKMVVTTMMHGNEPAGMEAARRVLRVLVDGAIPFAGELVVLIGNTRATAAGVRYLHRDLNRQWTPERIEAIRGSSSDERVEGEDGEIYELLGVLEDEMDPGRPGYFLDLHTTSAEGGAFVLFGDTLRNRSFGAHIPLTFILGLEEQIDGTLLEYMNGLGHVTLGCEGGQHDSSEAIDNHEAVLWLCLESAGMIPEGLELSARYREHLESVRGELPSSIQVRYRHPVQSSDRFHMRPGFSNLTGVTVGTLLARDRMGEIHARWDGWLLMPLYQGQGHDGFFLALTVRPAWLRVSSVLRRLRLAIVLRLLPGVSAHPERADTLVVDTSVARWFPLDIFHLFGYRKIRWQGSILLVSRRKHDLSPAVPKPEIPETS